jgi:hypothetical protein
VPTGPSLAAVTFTPAIETAAGWRVRQKPTVIGLNGAPDPNVCCCHVTGTVSNGNTVPTHVVISFAAMNAGNTEIGRVAYFARDLQPGTSAPVDAPGFVFPCAEIAHVRYELKVTAVDLPVM